MKKHLFSLSLLLVSIALAGGNSAIADESGDPLLDLLVRKKILTEKEAGEVREELRKEQEKKAPAADKLKLSSAVTELKLYGDLRFRYQYDNVDPQVPDSPRRQERTRWRFRLRLNADFKLTDNWFGGVQLRTSNQADSGFQTYEGGFRSYEIFISRAFVGWEASDWATFVLGKQANPFYTTDLLWDPDINPSGIVEQIKLHKLLPESPYTAPNAPERPWDLNFVAGQFIFADNNDLRAANAYLFGQQLVFSYRFSKDVKLTVAPAYLTYNPTRVSSALNTRAFSRETDAPLVVDESADLSLLQLPGDIVFPFCGQKIKFLWDSVYNFKGSDRARRIYRLPNHSGVDDFAFLMGIQVNENEKKGDWSAFLNFRQVGMTSIDPNLNDSDWGLSALNLRGFKGGIAYSFTDFAVGNVNYNAAWNVRKSLTGGQATNGANLGDANAVQVFQVELNVKF